MIINTNTCTIKYEENVNPIKFETIDAQKAAFEFKAGTKSKEGFYFASSLNNGIISGTWKKMGLVERTLRWVFSSLFPNTVLSTDKKCYNLSVAIFKKLSQGEKKPNSSDLDAKAALDPKLVVDDPKPEAKAPKLVVDDPKPESPKPEANDPKIAPEAEALKVGNEDLNVQPKAEAPKIFPLPPTTPQDAPLSAALYGLNSDENPNRIFPDVPPDVKIEVMKENTQQMCKLISDFPLTPDGVFADRNRSHAGTVESLKEEGKKLFDKLIEHVEFFPLEKDSILNKGTAFLRPGEFVQSPIQLDYDESFTKFDEKHRPRGYFNMYSTPAPNANQYKLKLPESRDLYFARMRETMRLGIQIELKKNDTIIWNAFGLGAFLRNALPVREESYEIRKAVAVEFFSAFDEVMSALPEERRKQIRLEITGPTGKGLPEGMKEEPRDNYNALVLGAIGSEFKDHVLFLPETDAYVRAQQLTNLMVEEGTLEEGEVARIAVINAGCTSSVGNHWYFGRNSQGKMNANYAAEENLHRRMKTSFMSYLISGGLITQNISNSGKNPTAGENIATLKAVHAQSLK